MRASKTKTGGRKIHLSVRELRGMKVDAKTNGAQGQGDECVSELRCRFSTL